jgi:hypothetical protein
VPFRAFIEAHGKGAIYCCAFLAQAHGKEGSLPWVFLPRRTAKRALCRAFFSHAHGKESHTPFGSGAVSCFCVPCVVKKRTTNIVYRALSYVAHDKDALPCKMLPCALCRAPRRKKHDKEFAVRFWAFAVRPCARGARQSRGFPLWR